MKTAWTSRGTAMRVRPFLKIVNWVCMSSNRGYRLLRDRSAARPGAATAGRIDQLTTSGGRPPPPGSAARPALAVRGPSRRAPASPSRPSSRPCTRTGSRLASCWRVSRSVGGHQVGAGLLERRDHRVDAGLLGRRGAESAAASLSVAAARSAPASRAGSVVVMSSAPQRPTRIFRSGNRARSRLHRYRVCARPPGGVAAMQTTPGPPLGHQVEQLGGQGPGGDQLEVPSGRVEDAAGASPGPRDPPRRGPGSRRSGSAARPGPSAGGRRVALGLARRGRRADPALADVLDDLADRLQGIPLVVLGDVAARRGSA